MDRSHKAKIQPLLLRSGWESANSPAQRGVRKGSKTAEGKESSCVHSSPAELARGLWRKVSKVKNTRTIKFMEHFQHGVHDTQILSCCLSFELSCLGSAVGYEEGFDRDETGLPHVLHFAKFNANETCIEYGTTGLCGRTVYSQAL